ncbi:ATP-binding cassette domain-containing protein [bacterium]|nr:ATP-binding cassette domain-containing protein [bacterium]
MHEDILLSIKNLTKHYPVGSTILGRAKETVRAVNGVTLSVKRGETLGLVGESGCGKSTLGRCILRLDEPTSGEIFFNKQDFLSLKGKALRKVRRDMQPIFQDPFMSLNPRKTVGRLIGEAFKIHGLLTTAQRQEKVSELLNVVGMRPEHAVRYPHEFSGGQRQRIAIARAIALNPALVIADEAVSALDVSIQAQILNLMITLQRQFNLTYIFISHDLSVVRHISDRIAVVYLGRVVELASVSQLFSEPKHPYTQSLLASIPVPDPGQKRKRVVLEGDIPSSIDFQESCPFMPRCRSKSAQCDLNQHRMPALTKVESEHYVACFNYN